MAKSQFTRLVLKDDKLKAEGKTSVALASDPMTHLHVAVVQGDRIFTADGTAGPPHGTWEFAEENPTGFELDEDAQALGLAIHFTKDDEALTFETFTWTQTLTVQRPT